MLELFSAKGAEPRSLPWRICNMGGMEKLI